MAAPERFGPYLLLDRINIGGMAEVFRGKQVGVEGFERLVALKRILPSVSSDPDFIDMFVDEAKIAVQLQHANIAQTYDLGKVGEQYYIALEYVSGVDLRTMWDRARKRKRLLPVAMSVYIVQKMCEGLDAAHRKTDDSGRPIGLVHRDVSPHNVLCSFEGEIKIIDFGIAKVANKVSKTQAGALKGKFGYMSPEQIRGVELDRRSDIFTVGTVLYELLVGRRLFRGTSDFSVLEKIRKVEFRPPSELNPRLDPELETIVMKALQKDRDARYPHASDMAEDLSRYLFSTDQRFGRTDLVRYMQQHFGEEMQAERARLERYRQISVPSDPSAVEPSPASLGAPEPLARGVVVSPAVPGGGPSRAQVQWRPAEPADPTSARAPGPQASALPKPPARGPTLPVPRAPGPVSEDRPLMDPYPEGTAPWIGQSHSHVVRPSSRLPTWAAMLIGALAVIALGAVGALAWVLWSPDEPRVRVLQEASPGGGGSGSESDEPEPSSSAR